MKSSEYMQNVRAVLEYIEQTQMINIDLAAERVVESIMSGGTVFVLGTGHASIMAQETFFRAGGMMLFNPVMGPGLSLDVRPVDISTEIERMPGYGEVVMSHTPIKRGDVLIIASTAGRNSVPIDAALWSKQNGIQTIGITSRTWADSVSSRHPSGKKLHDVVDVVLDDGVPPGDASVDFADINQKVGPVSTISGVTLINLIVVRTVERLVDEGFMPPVFKSANLDGADEYNRRTCEDFKERIHYL
jgi:uncharacterized phosphosugar-binding protein